MGDFEGDGEGEFAVYGAGSGEYGGFDFDLMVGVTGFLGKFFFLVCGSFFVTFPPFSSVSCPSSFFFTMFPNIDGYDVDEHRKKDLGIIMGGCLAAIAYGRRGCLFYSFLYTALNIRGKEKSAGHHSR